MNLERDILDKYSQEQVVAYLDTLLFGVLKNYNMAIEKGTPEILYANLGDLVQARAILHEQRRRDKEKEALKSNSVIQ